MNVHSAIALYVCVCIILRKSQSVASSKQKHGRCRQTNSFLMKYKEISRTFVGSLSPLLFLHMEIITSLQLPFHTHTHWQYTHAHILYMQCVYMPSKCKIRIFLLNSLSLSVCAHSALICCTHKRKFKHINYRCDGLRNFSSSTYRI